MDPTANLKEQAILIMWLANGRFANDRRGLRKSLSDLRSALSDWLTSGGFAPDWTRYPTAARYYGK
jgi:hypothetical protein